MVSWGIFGDADAAAGDVGEAGGLPLWASSDVLRLGSGASCWRLELCRCCKALDTFDSVVS